MCLTPKVLLSSIARERCIAGLRDIPAITLHSTKPKYSASVLIPLCVANGEVCLLYTLRSAHLRNHKGQVSFPGGMTDGNEHAIDTALREAEEEIGISRDSVDIWAIMPQFQGRNKDILITPVVGEILNFDINQLKANEQEVEEIFTMPMKSFCDTNLHAHLEYKKFPLPVYLMKHKIWGITGLITHFFLQVFLPDTIYNPDFMRKKFELNELMTSKL